MRKVSILKRKVIQAYNNPKNWEYSEFKGYSKGTYFGYKSLNDCLKDTLNSFKKCYGKGLRHLMTF